MPGTFEEQGRLISDAEIIEEIYIKVLAKLNMNTSRIQNNLYFFIIRQDKIKKRVSHNC